MATYSEYRDLNFPPPPHSFKLHPRPLLMRKSRADGRPVQKVLPASDSQALANHRDHLDMMQRYYDYDWQVLQEVRERTDVDLMTHMMGHQPPFRNRNRSWHNKRTSKPYGRRPAVAEDTDHVLQQSPRLLSAKELQDAIDRNRQQIDGRLPIMYVMRSTLVRSRSSRSMLVVVMIALPVKVIPVVCQCLTVGSQTGICERACRRRVTLGISRGPGGRSGIARKLRSLSSMYVAIRILDRKLLPQQLVFSFL